MPLSLDILSYIVYALAVLIAVVFVLLIRNEMRLRRLLQGKSARTLEDTIKHLDKNLKNLTIFKEEAEKRLKKNEGELLKTIQSVGIVRFNPFKGTSGSNQSFVIALLNKKGDGVVFSSIYSREHVSVFAKPIENKVSEYDLSKEEKEAIAIASNSQ